MQGAAYQQRWRQIAAFSVALAEVHTGHSLGGVSLPQTHGNITVTRKRLDLWS